MTLQRIEAALRSRDRATATTLQLANATIAAPGGRVLFAGLSLQIAPLLVASHDRDFLRAIGIDSFIER